MRLKTRKDKIKETGNKEEGKGRKGCGLESDTETKASIIESKWYFPQVTRQELE